MLEAELADEIFGSAAFLSDLRALEIANLEWELGDDAGKRESHFDEKQIARLLQSALIFASSDESRLERLAQKISTSVLKLAGLDNRSVVDVFELIQARLRNFPALLSENPDFRAPSLAPPTLQYEFVRTKLRQTVQISGEKEFVLTPFQMQSWEVLRSGRSTALSAPTSAGKSFVLLLHVINQLRNGNASTVVYIVPTRALINQVMDDFASAFTQRGMADVTVTSVPVDLQSDGKEDQKVLYVVTQERLEALLIEYPLFHIDLLVIDEAQVLSQGARGVLLESVVDRVLGRDLARPQIVFSGPMIENPAYFGTLFELDEFAPAETERSTVSQNLLYVSYRTQPSPHVRVSLSEYPEIGPTTEFSISARLGTDNDRLSYLSYFFGRSGSNLVYTGGKADAEKIAIKISQELPAVDGVAKLNELINFVKSHVHKEYALVETLKKGVGFHYGHMPSLLRKELEEYFKARRLSHLVCTSTLLYGLNLPAKNIFMLKPTKGRGSEISGPDFWNLAGRAGRLGKELEGNVFLLDYESWPSKPASAEKGISVASALKETMVDHVVRLTHFLNDSTISSEAAPELEITLGKLILDERTSRLQNTIERYRTSNNSDALSDIAERVRKISQEVSLPTEVLNRNIGVSVFRQSDLFSYMLKRLAEIPPEELIPAHPLDDFTAASNSYRRAFKRIHTYLLKLPGKDNSHNFFSPLALRWMRGDRLPILIDAAIRYHRTKKKGKSTAAIIRDTMENVEDDLRFRYVKFFSCYNSILEVALKVSGHIDYLANIPNVPLFLEMGASSGAMINLMALGLSRTTAEAVIEYITDKEMSVGEIREWVVNQNFEGRDISPACLREVQELVARISVGPSNSGAT